MILSIDTWLLPAIAAASSSYLVSLGWERFRKDKAPSGTIAGLLATLSFLMGAICSYSRHTLYRTGLENNIIVMFIVGATTTQVWLSFRRFLPFFRK